MSYWMFAVLLEAQSNQIRNASVLITNEYGDSLKIFKADLIKIVRISFEFGKRLKVIASSLQSVTQVSMQLDPFHL